MSADSIGKALRRAFNLGQQYWQQADSDSYKQNAKSHVTRDLFDELVTDTIRALPSAELERDAERYRWLRSHRDADGNIDDDFHVHVDGPQHLNKWALVDAELDAAIDAARAKEAPR